MSNAESVCRGHRSKVERSKVIKGSSPSSVEAHPIHEGSCRVVYSLRGSDY